MQHLFCIPCCQNFCIIVANSSVFLIAKNSVLSVADYTRIIHGLGLNYEQLYYA